MVRRKGLWGIDNRHGRVVRGILDMVGSKVSMAKTTLDIGIQIQENVKTKLTNTNKYLLVLIYNDRLWATHLRMNSF